MARNTEELEKEFLKIFTDMEKKAAKDIKPILKAYKGSLDNVSEMIGKIYAEYSTEGVLKVGKQQKYTILKMVEKQLLEEYKKLGGIDEEVTTNILKDIYRESFLRTAYTIEKGITVQTNFALLNPKIVEKAVFVKYKGHLFSDRIWTNKKLLVNKLKQEINNGIVTGESVDKLARRIKQTFGQSSFASFRLVNTEMARVVSQAQNDIYTSSNVVKKVMWTATLDKKTCRDCAELDGKMWSTNENHPVPPVHPLDRCCIIPVIDGWNPIVRKDNTTEENIAYSRYDDWLKSKEKDIP